MARAFTGITFTPSVKTAQLLYGSRKANQGLRSDLKTSNGPGAPERLAIGSAWVIEVCGDQGRPSVSPRPSSASLTTYPITCNNALTHDRTP
jgi:hypothetical protein